MRHLVSNRGAWMGALTAAMLLPLAHSARADAAPHAAHTLNPAGHAPASIMADHMHSKGEWMAGYRLMALRQSDLQHGTDDLSGAEAAMLGYSMLPTEMDMWMHMLDLMVAPSDNLTLMLMPSYMYMDMTMEAAPAMESAHDAHDAGAHAHGHGDMEGRHSHATEGIGDTQAFALIRLWHNATHHVHAGLGVSIPTGSVDEKTDGVFTHYGMQLGSGTWDALPSLTYLGKRGNLSWGAQGAGVYRLEDENDSGFRFGDVWQVNTWTAVRTVSWLSLSGRVGYRQEGDIEGHYNGPHNHSSPPDLQANYGSELVDAGLGANAHVPLAGLPHGLRLGVELSAPLHEDVNGVQLGRAYAVAFSGSAAF